MIIITRNEERNIADCIGTAGFAHEWIVVDSGSTDGTVERARAAGATVHQFSDWLGFGVQKNRALDLASGDWVLSLDADERVSAELAREIVTIIREDVIDACMIRTEADFYGWPIRHSEYYPNTASIRLFRRHVGRFTNVLVHENVRLNSGAARCALLKTPLQHYSYRDPAAYLRKIDQYSELAAQMMFQAGRRGSLRAAVLHAMAAFLKSYVVRRGFLDGRGGLLVAVYAAEATYHKYFKLLLLNRAIGASGRPQR